MFLNPPGLERLELLHVLDRRRDVPDLWKRKETSDSFNTGQRSRMKRRPTVGVDHQDRSSSRGILASDRLGRDLLSPLGQVLGVVNDLSDDATSSEVVLHVPSDLELQREKNVKSKVRQEQSRIQGRKDRTLKWLKPWLSASLVSCRTLSSLYPSHPTLC